MSGAKEDDYLCEGLAEEIISALTLVPGLRVIARTSSFLVGRMELDYNWPEVDRECGRALELNPDSPLVRQRTVMSRRPCSCLDTLG